MIMTVMVNRFFFVVVVVTAWKQTLLRKAVHEQVEKGEGQVNTEDVQVNSIRWLRDGVKSTLRLPWILVVTTGAQ